MGGGGGGGHQGHVPSLGNLHTSCAPLQIATPWYVHTRSETCTVAQFHGATEPATCNLKYHLKYVLR